jgi:cytochrome c553
MKKLLYLSSLLLLVGIAVESCKSDSNSPGFEYMPDMYRSPAVEAYQEVDYTVNGMSARKPADNTISMSDDPYPYPNTNEGYEEAGMNLKNPIPFSEDVLDEGKQIFKNFCIHCHGKDGTGTGSVPENSDYPPPPSYSGPLKDLPEGKIFHSIHYGKNLMGSHASQISKEDRWKLVHYVQFLQDNERKMSALNGGAASNEMPAEESEQSEPAQEEMTEAPAEGDNETTN